LYSFGTPPKKKRAGNGEKEGEQTISGALSTSSSSCEQGEKNQTAQEKGGGRPLLPLFFCFAAVNLGKGKKTTT